MLGEPFAVEKIKSNPLNLLVNTIVGKRKQKKFESFLLYSMME